MVRKKITAKRKRISYRHQKHRKVSLGARLKKFFFGTSYRRVFWTSFFCIVLFYAFIFSTYFASPYRSLWRAIYGDVSYPAGFSIHGIDISHHQGNIKWEKVANAKIDDEPIAFVMIKATEGKSHLDENFNDNFYQAREYGFIRGAYHYFSPSVSGKEQAQHYLHQVHLGEGDLPPILDIEEIGNLTFTQLQKQVLDWLRIVEEQYDVAPIIYTGLKFKETYLSSIEFDRYPFWIAHYYVKEVGYKGEWRFWQHTDVGHIDGIRGSVDLDIYNGSMYDLRHLTIGHDEDPLLQEDVLDSDSLQ